MRPTTLALFAALSLLAATAGVACAGQPIAGKCPGGNPVPCMTREVCAEDTKRGCMVCTCESAENTMPPPKPNTQPE